MYQSAGTIPLWLVTSMATLAHGSIEFFIDATFDKCSRNNNNIACLNNTDRGGLCAYAPDANMLWCCPAPDPSCWGFESSCTGGSSAAPGPGQIACSQDGAQWCCNQEYELCTQAKNQINVCNTNFASANANVSIAEANAVESSSTSSGSLEAATLSSISSTSSSTVPSKATTSSSPLSSPSSNPNTSDSSSPDSSPSSTPQASQSSSHLSSGAIAGIVIAALVVSCLVGFGIMRARRRKGNKAKAMPPMAEAHDTPAIGKYSMKAELDGKGTVSELPSQDVRHEMI